MAELEFKYLNEIDISDSLTDSAHVIVEDGGNIRRATMGQLITGGGVSSWNDLTDKPFYEEDSFEEILPETTLTMNNVSGMGMGSIVVDHTKITLGKIYKMVWDGVTYEAPAFEVSGQSGESGEVITLVAIGNPAIGNFGEDNGIPFFAGNADNGTGVPTDNLMVITTDTAATHTLSISVGSTTIHTIDEKFIPDTIARVFDIPEQKTYTVNGVAADENGNIEIEVGSGSGLPEVSVENNGAFLRVVDGAWAIVNMTDVSTEGA